MILTQQQAQEVAKMMKCSPQISVDMPLGGSEIERVKVVHERTCPIYRDKVLVWQQIGGITHGEEKYADRTEFLAAYGLSAH